MKTKHTPGPWSIHPMTQEKVKAYDNNDGTHFCARTFYIGQGEKIIGQVDYFSESHGYPRVTSEFEAAANARLISAAPELLEALKGVVRVADRATDEFDAARAAIAKVTS